jgi:hypothetical protein
MGLIRKAAIGAVGGLCLAVLKLIDAKFFLTTGSTEMLVGYLTYFSFLLLGMAVAAFLRRMINMKPKLDGVHFC